MPDKMLGRLIVERVVSDKDTRTLFTVFFDSLGNATETPDDSMSWHYSLTMPSNVYEWFGVRVLEEFFANLAAGDGPSVGGLMKVPISGV